MVATPTWTKLASCRSHTGGSIACGSEGLHRQMCGAMSPVWVVGCLQSHTDGLWDKKVSLASVWIGVFGGPMWVA